MISAEAICDSISEQEHRLTTYKLRYPRFIHSEFMTHRVISRNASSSRAIPTAKLIEEVRSDALRAAPVFWGKNQKGMGAREELTGIELDEIQHLWRIGAILAAEIAEKMFKRGAAKEYVNRGLEPYSHINVVTTATEWDNFFGLRLHRDAQPEMRALAIAMWEARKASAPKLLKPGEWHLPFVSDEDRIAAEAIWPDKFKLPNETVVRRKSGGLLITVSVARCARVSYESFETGKRSTIEEDLKLYDRLVGSQPMHASPAEHQATPDEWFQMHEVKRPKGMAPINLTGVGTWSHEEQHGNFVGWRQFRQLLPGQACASIPEEFR